MSIDLEEEEEENKDWWTKYFASLEFAGHVSISITKLKIIFRIDHCKHIIYPTLYLICESVSIPELLFWSLVQTRDHNNDVCDRRSGSCSNSQSGAQHDGTVGLGSEKTDQHQHMLDKKKRHSLRGGALAASKLAQRLSPKAQRRKDIKNIACTKVRFE